MELGKSVRYSVEDSIGRTWDLILDLVFELVNHSVIIQSDNITSTPITDTISDSMYDSVWNSVRVRNQ